MSHARRVTGLAETDKALRCFLLRVALCIVVSACCLVPGGCFVIVDGVVVVFLLIAAVPILLTLAVA